MGRYGGDEFVLILEGLHSVEDVELVARKLRAEFALPFVLGEVTLPSVTASIGAAYFKGEDIALAKVVARADEALCKAKRSGRDAFVVSRWHAKESDKVAL